MKRYIEIATLVFILVGYGWISWSIRQLDERVSSLETRIAVLDLSPPQVAGLKRMAARERVRDAARLEVTDAARKCREMGQVPVEGITSFLDRGRAIVCLQAPSISFELEPEWPQ